MNLYYIYRDIYNIKYDYRNNQFELLTLTQTLMKTLNNNEIKK